MGVHYGNRPTGNAPASKLLNEYGGAAAAYSLRLLDLNNASNPVVRARRASDNEERDFTASEVLADLETWANSGNPTAPTGGTISVITDPNDGKQYRVHTFTSDGTFETPVDLEVEYLIVGGGGAGAVDSGGGGAGGFRTGTLTVLAEQHTVTVGAGGVGTGSTSDNQPAASGQNSVFSTITAAGGGGGGGNIIPGQLARPGADGGSGGGSGDNSSSPGGSGNVPNVSPSQGNDGGNSSQSASGYGGGGGGGAGAAGSNGTSSSGGNGGNGSASSITGTSVTYAGGGGGSARSGTPGSGGSGGGGNASISSNGSAGTANTGGGGGGTKYGSLGGNGGSGIVIIRYEIGNVNADAFVTTWYDQSGNDNHATQTTATEQPKIVNAGTLVTENGKAAVDFDGVDDGLQAIFNTDYEQQNTIFLTAKLDSLNDVFIAVDGYASQSVSSNGRHSIGVTNNKWYLFSGNFPNSTNAINPNTDSQTLVVGLFDSTNSKIYVDSTSSANGDTGGYFIDGITIGCRNDFNDHFWDGNISEAIIYPSDQSNNRTAIESNINSYYDIY